jgi:hypothetical protein
VPVDRPPITARQSKHQQSQNDSRYPVGRLSVPHEDTGFPARSL